MSAATSLGLEVTDQSGDFSYGSAAAAQGVGLADRPSVAIFADRPHLRDQLREDAMVAGYRVTSCDPFSALLSAGMRNLAEVVLVDCPCPDGAGLATLAALDQRIEQSGAQLIVATSRAGLEDVFGCVDQSARQLLVDASATDLAVALGRAVALLPGRGVREMADEDRIQLMRLTEQVGRIAARLDAAGDRGGRVESPVLAFRGHHPDEVGSRLTLKGPAMPDPRLIRRILRQRQQRARWFDAELFADPAWDMLLDLTAAWAEDKRVSVTSLCIASGVPPTTALRWITQLTQAGLFQRVEDSSDRRRAFITLTERAAAAMAGYFAALGEKAVTPI